MAESHVMSALVEKRSRLLGEILARRFQIMRLEVDLSHVDAVIRMFRPSYDLDAILPKITFRKNPGGVPRGAGSRQALTVLREAGCPLTAREIAERVLSRLGKPQTDETLTLLVATIHSTFTRRRDGAVLFDASTQPGRWCLR